MKILQKSRPVSALFLVGTLILSFLSAPFLSPAASAATINKVFNCSLAESVTINVTPGDVISFTNSCGFFGTQSFNSSILTVGTNTTSLKTFAVSLSLTAGTYVDAIDLYAAKHTKYTLIFAGSPTFSASTPAIPDTTLGSTSATQTETITNTGTADLTFGASAVAISGTNSSDFAIVADSCSSQSIVPTGYCTVTYTFTPTATGSRTANLVFTDNAAGSPHTVVLTGTGTAPLSNDNTLASATIKGQSATLGTPSIAPGAATPGTVTISGPQSTSSTASVFTKSDPLAEVTRVVKYGFGASTSGFGTDTQYLDSDTISNRDFFVIQVKSESSRYLYYVINVTVASAGPGFSASAPNIPNTYIGSNSPTQTVTITNSGTANLVYGRRAVVLSGSNSSDFAIVADNCSNRSIAAARTCTVSFRFTPTSTGSRTANLVFTDNATGSPHTVVLTGTGVAAPLSISRLSESESGVRGGGRLTITGTGFANSATVTIGDVLAVVLQRSGTTGITVRIPAHARGIVSVVVTNPDLTSASIGGFRYR